jgi:hypothetical protein
MGRERNKLRETSKRLGPGAIHFDERWAVAC